MIYILYVYILNIHNPITCTSKSSKVKAPQQYDNQGCGQKLPKGSFGPAFNRAGGAEGSLKLHATERESFTGSIRTYQNIQKSYTGWWFGTFFIFPYIDYNHPN